jgi:hypothetical protein
MMSAWTPRTCTSGSSRCPSSSAPGAAWASSATRRSRSSGTSRRLVFAHDGRPFLEYSSRTWILDADGQRLRAGAREAGWWRPGKERRDVEVLLSHPTGIVEVYVGEVVFHKIELQTDVVARTETSKEVNALHRLYGLVEGDLAYAVDMAAVGQPLQPHLSARLSRVDAPGGQG